MTADTALRLGRLFGVEPHLWMNLQSQFDLEIAELELRAQVDQDVEPPGRAA
jgi:plasmid maintenance system antidote protein VapI